MIQSFERSQENSYVNWFAKSLDSKEPNCVLVASIQEELSLSVLEEFNIEYQNSFCRKCIFNSGDTNPNFICSQHELLALDENYFIMSRCKVLISKNDKD